MADMAISFSNIERLNNKNYNPWSTLMEFYLRGQYLWDIVAGSQTTPPTVPKACRNGMSKSGKHSMCYLSPVMIPCCHRTRKPRHLQRRESR
ncbi:hypothetical protein LINPERHAP2_LOCUS41898 [Linum perenne]